MTTIEAHLTYNITGRLARQSLDLAVKLHTRKAQLVAKNVHLEIDIAEMLYGDFAKTNYKHIVGTAGIDSLYCLWAVV